MTNNPPEILRKYGYDILINRFEPLFREILKNEVLLLNYGLKNWREGIPEGVKTFLKKDKDLDIYEMDINDFFDEIYLWSLKEISIFSNHYQYLSDFTNNLGKERFIEVVDELNEIRKKIAHSKTFTNFELLRLIDIIKTCFSGKHSEKLIQYLDNESYKSAENLPPDFLTEYGCPNNLPTEEYDLDGGFVGRRKEILSLKRYLYSNQDRIITITGAGGSGKTAIALKLAYSILADIYNPYEAIIWFSAKESKLSAEEGIVSITSEIKNKEQLLKDILAIIDSPTYEMYEKTKADLDTYAQHLSAIFSSQRCLLIIDNLETLLKDQDTTEFIKNIPRPSQILITSRKGIGEIEKRYPLPDFDEKSAVELFRLIAREKNRVDLLRLDKEIIINLVKKVMCYPLLIKWSIGKVCLGEDINQAFSQIYSGKTEIAQFVFNDIFELFSQDAKKCLFGLVVLGDRSVSKHMLMHLTNLNDDAFDDAIRELMIASFIFQEVHSNNNKEIITNYAMLSLTRGFVQTKLDEDQTTLLKMEANYHELTLQIDELEKSKKAYSQSLFSLGIKSEEQKIAFNYVKTAKNFWKNQQHTEAEINFNRAIEIAPTFSYALIEYAKYEYDRHHTNESNKLFEKAIKSDNKNFHSFFAYGSCLKRQDRISEAIEKLEEAKKLNPQHLPIYNELGRVYSFNAEYEKAQQMFEQAKTQQEYQNYKHMIITLYYQADNYRRWSESFFERKDIDEGMQKLHRGLELIREAIATKTANKSLYILEKQICLNIAINLCKAGKFEDSLTYFDKCLEKIKLTGLTLTSDYEMAKANYYLGYFAFKFDKMSPEKILVLVKRGLAINRDDKYTSKLLTLKKKVESKLNEPKNNLLHGIIQWFNKAKNYGIIRSENKTYLFFGNCFNRNILEREKEELSGRQVSFILENNPLKKDSIATNINLEY